MTGKLYIVLGNHRSFAGIKEIVYTLQSALSEQFSVELSCELKSSGVNIVIDDFSASFDVEEIRKIKALHPDTKIVIVATEFVTPISVLGVELTTTFNFFGGSREWLRAVKGLIRGNPSYMRSRYRGFANAIQYCDLLATIHPSIVPTTAELSRNVAPNLPTPLLIYPQICPLSAHQEKNLSNLPVGFTLTGTLTPYRRRVASNLVHEFRRAGLTISVLKTSFQQETVLLDYDSGAPEYLFNLNPPQSENWPHSSPMRIMRALLLGQIPVITKRFHDHPLENLAIFWDGKLETAVELGSRQFIDRQAWLNGYMRTIEAYDREAKEANKPFINATLALLE